MLQRSGKWYNKTETWIMAEPLIWKISTSDLKSDSCVLIYIHKSLSTNVLMGQCKINKNTKANKPNERNETTEILFLFTSVCNILLNTLPKPPTATALSPRST